MIHEWTNATIYTHEWTNDITWMDKYNIMSGQVLLYCVYSWMDKWYTLTSMDKWYVCTVTSMDNWTYVCIIINGRILKSWIGKYDIHDWVSLNK